MPVVKPLAWMVSAKDDLSQFPPDVRAVMGEALFQAQKGNEHPRAKALSGFGGRGVLEIIDDFDGDTYRAVYTVKFAGIVYALHAFMKKSRRGIATPASDMKLVRQRLKAAEEHYERWKRQETGKS